MTGGFDRLDPKPVRYPKEIVGEISTFGSAMDAPGTGRVVQPVQGWDGTLIGRYSKL